MNARLVQRLLTATLATVFLWIGSSLTPASGTRLPDETASFHEALDPDLFPVPEVLEPNVQFWLDIFTRYSSTQVVIHDEVHLDVIYQVVDVADLEESESNEVRRAQARRHRVDATQNHIKSILRALADGQEPQASANEVERIRALWAQTPGGRNKYAQALTRLRSQRGLADRFEEAIQISGMFMPGIEDALRAEGVPIEIRCLPFVESMFNYKARSKVGASGAWQFTAATGRLFLKIDAAVDERSDVLLAATGAARLLRSNYERLGAWPLALTAYNHGTAGIARAVQKTGTRDIGYISQHYRSRSFGFASRNFYAEFVAALVAYADREKYFPGLVELAPVQFDTFEAPLFVSLPRLASEASIEVATLADLNPALSGEVVRGNLLIPRGYRLRVPTGTGADIEEAYRRLGDDQKHARQTAHGYRVRRGDTLGSIARRYGTSTQALQQANHLSRPDRIYAGQYLVIPGVKMAAAPSPPVAAVEIPVDGTTHVVGRGQTLSWISARYGITPEQLAMHNDLRNPDRLSVGQRLSIPGSGAAVSGPEDIESTNGVEGGQATQYEVRAGDSLYSIARRTGTSVDALKRLNGLGSNLIKPGQILLIPAG